MLNDLALPICGKIVGYAFSLSSNLPDVQSYLRWHVPRFQPCRQGGLDFWAIEAESF